MLVFDISGIAENDDYNHRVVDADAEPGHCQQVNT